jgi:hypothetical protein
MPSHDSRSTSDQTGTQTSMELAGDKCLHRQADYTRTGKYVYPHPGLSQFFVELYRNTHVKMKLIP